MVLNDEHKGKSGENDDTVHEPYDPISRKILERYLGLRTCLLLVGLATVGVILVTICFPQSDSSIVRFLGREVGKGLILATVVTFGINVLVRLSAGKLDQHLEELKNRVHDTRHKEVTRFLHQIDGQVSKQTKRLRESVSALEAVGRCGISMVYANRKEASLDIKEAIEDERVDSIKIIGISLNDFLRWDSNDLLCEAWTGIEKRIREQLLPEGVETLDIRVLLIDPESNGARWRAEAEGTDDDRCTTRLQSDVEDAIKRVKGLLLSGKSDDPSSFTVSVTARLYRTPPILYLVRTPFVSFVQFYHFRPTHRASLDIPVFRFASEPDCPPKQTTMHEELDFHFDWIWDHASVDVEQYVDAYFRGIDCGSRQAHIINIYNDRSVSRKRILHLIEDSKNKRIWLKGISLKSYFRQGSELYHALCKACERSDMQLRFLLIDSDCEQAKIRSFREFLINNPDATYSEFCSKQEFEAQILNKDTSESRRTIGTLLRDLERLEKKGHKVANVQFKLFDSAPESFMLLTDSTVIVEQYHYGQFRQHPGRFGIQQILNKDVPLIEYAKDEVESCEPEPGSEGRPYGIFEDHFDFVWEHCARIDEYDATDHGHALDSDD